MKTFHNWLQCCLLLVAVLCSPAYAEDIDIFAGTSEVNTALPSVLFVLDNTANWSNNANKWDGIDGGTLVQGAAEVRSILTVLNSLEEGTLNVGLMEFTTDGNADQQNGMFVRHHLQEYTGAAKTRLDGVLTTIFNNVNDNTEKKQAPDQYGYVLDDVYNYLSGADQSKGGAATPGTLADENGYDPLGDWSSFQSPLVGEDVCVNTYVIYVGNNGNGNIAYDDSDNTDNLEALYAVVGETPPDGLATGSANSGPDEPPLPIQAFSYTYEDGPDVIIEESVLVPAVPPSCSIPDDIPPVDVAVGTEVGVSQGKYKDSQLGSCTTEEYASGSCSGRPANVCECTDRVANVNGQFYTRKVEITTAYQIPGVYYDEDDEVCNGGEDAYWTDLVYGPGERIETATPLDDPDETNGWRWNMDDWAKALFSYGVPVDVEVDGQTVTERAKVVTYTIDAFKIRPGNYRNEQLSAVWQSTADVGGGRYFQATNEADVLAAFYAILGDILADSSTFAAVSLPVSATNRERQANQVYIGMFRPAPGKSPRWNGNLKRYQLALFGIGVDRVPDLADVNLQRAVNPLSGFIADCAASFWTEDTGTYWQNLNVDPPPFSKCIDPDYTGDPNWSGWSDLPDGPFVEKGGVAQEIREGPAADAREIFTSSVAALRALATSDAPAIGGTDVYNYLRGGAPGINETMPPAGLRASAHGGVVHSRPLSIRFTAQKIMVYYGSNDGLFRAVDASNGAEIWSLVAPEHFGKIARLYNNAPLVEFTGAQEAPGVAHDPKDYFFDGSTGQLVRYSAEGALVQAYIYPTMRRGGRMIYALDVTDPDVDPTLLWKQGCDDSTCTMGFSDIGQTWSMPIGGYVRGYVNDQDEPQQVVMFGGGFDDCLNEDVAAYPAACSSAKGKGVYVLDATTGEVLKKFDTLAPVITDLDPIDMNFDGYIDFAYAADVAGNLYRVNFAAQGDANPANSIAPFEVDEWTMVKVAAMSDNTRRFYNSPVVSTISGIAIVTIGSGDRERPLEVNYPYATEVQNRFYAVADKPFLTFVASNPDEDAGEVTTIDLDGSNMYPVVADPDEVFSPETFDGWYLDLPDRGEQVANPAAVAGGRVFFNTFQPGGASNGICAKPKGIGTGYDVKLFSPVVTEGDPIAGGGIPIPPVIARVRIPPGLPPCDGDDCPDPPENQCETQADGCEIVTVCIGCKGFTPVEVVPDAPPKRRRMWFSEEIDSQ